MSPAGSVEPLGLPTEREWATINVVPGRELHGGFQSRVFAATYLGDHVVVKLTDRRLANPAFRERLDMVVALSELNDNVVGPIAQDVGLVSQLGGWLATLYPLVRGRAPDIDDEPDVRRMAVALVDLHQSLDRLGSVDLPSVAALAGAEATMSPGFSRTQLLHGDYSSANVLIAGAQVHILDFDEAGYGLPEFEVGNTLYMVLFDAVTSSEMSRYQRFRGWFVDEYRSASATTMADELLDESVQLRIRALSRWIDQPNTAPIGIRTASPTWRETLRAFVQSQS